MLKYIKQLCLIIMSFSVVFAATLIAVCPEGDINNDCVVDMFDLAILAGQWLQPDGSANIDGQSGVNTGDLLVMAGSWLDDREYVIISEIGASNSRTVKDEDGDSSDWIELYNPTRSAVNLQDWSLINDIEGTVKWQIPSIEIGPNEFIVIFASGKDRRDPTGELHTNFKLDAEGEYLALVNDDGTTVVFSYDPDFGVQYPDVSFGISQHAEPTVLIGPTSQGKLLVPDAADDLQIGSSWIGESIHEPFDDSLWYDVLFGVGFDTRNSSTSDVNLAFGKTATQSSEWGGFPASNATDGALNNFTHTATGDYSPWWKIDLEETFFINEIVMYNRTSCCQERLYNITVEVFDLNDVLVYTSEVLNPVLEGSAPVSPGEYLTLDLDDLPAGGISGRYIRISKTFVTGTAEYLTFGEVEVFGVESYTDSIESDVESEMKGINSSCYLRIPFEVEDTLDIDTAVLRVKYDDGFAAYLNGSLIASANVPTGAIAYDAEAFAIHLAEDVEEFPVPLGLLKNGNNILAIHGLNYSANNESFLIIPELEVHRIGMGDIAYFMEPTPGKVNGQGALGFVSDTTFDMDRGFYDDPFEVQITTKTPGASIIYTLDGSAPTLTNGTQVPSSGPDTIPTATVQISSTTVLRAAAFKDTFHPSNTDTQTYIFLDDIIASNVMNTAITQDPRYAPHMRQALTDLPTVSIVSNSDHLQQYIVGPYPEWAYDEFPVSIEWIMLDGSFGFQEDAGAARFGGHWYDRPGGIPFNKWSFRLYFRAEYGKPKLKAPIFEGFDHGIAPTDVFDQLDLRTGSHDMSQRGFYMSSPLTADTMLEMGNVNPHSRFVHLYINGTYWGQYNLHERWNSDMVSQYMGGEKEEYESIKTKINVGGWNDMGVPYDGDGSTWQNVLSLRNNYEQVKSWLDVQSYVDFMLMWMFGRSEEEYRCVGSIAENVVGFQFWLNDPDGFTRDVGDKTGSYGPGHIFHYLFAESNPDYRTFLADRIHEHFFNNGGLTRTAMTEKLLERCDQIDVAFFAEAARWGYRTPDSWAGARDNYINNILSSRPQTLLDQLRNAGFYPNVVAPVFHINDVYQHGGMVISGAELSMSAPAGTIYYTLDGSDPRLQGGQINPTAFSHDTGGNGDNTLITKGSTWKYLDDGTDQGAAWTDLSFNDNLWKSGAAQLGYGDGDEVTVVSFGTDPNDKFVTTYFRHTFYETDALLFTDLSGWLLRDDGAIVYLNGTEIYRSNMPAGPVGYLTPASNVTRGGAESTFNAITAIDTDLLVSGDNNITVEVHQQNITSSDISFDFELTASIDSNDLITKTPIENSTIVKSRVLKDGLWSALNEAVFGVGSVKENLLITEIMYHPAGDPNSEFIELKNVGTETINLNLVKFANGIDFIFSSVTLAAGEHVVVVKNIAAFNDRYTSFSGTVAGEYVGSLDNNGEKVRLQDALGTVIHEFSYKDGWYGITDGGGFTLTVIDPANANPAMYGNKDTWRASTHHGGSPGTDDGGPNPGDIVINELLAHSDAWPNDWIELYNASGVQIYIGGWYLSDNNDDDPNLMKYRIANGTTIAAGGYVVFTQDEHFGNAFALSENGEKVCLTSSAGGELTGYREVESFGASEVGVSLGRHYKASTDTYNFVAMSNTTKGYANAYPKVGPVVISEIMYNPSAGGSYSKGQYEYIELCNVSGSTVTLFDEDLNLGWTFTDGIDYTFDQNAKVDPGERIIIARNIAAFEERHGYSAGVLGPFENGTKLKNEGERLQLGKPGDIDEDGIRQYIRVDRVTYGDGSEGLWPIEAAEEGKSLTRKILTDYGNDAANWKAEQESPGQ